MAVRALAFLGEPVDEPGRVGDFPLGFGQWLPVLEGHDQGKVVAVLQDQVVPAPDDLAAFLGGAGPPVGPRRLGCLDGAGGLRSAHLRHGSDRATVCRIVDRDRFSRVGVLPFTANAALLKEKRGIAKRHEWLAEIDIHAGVLPRTVPAAVRLA